MGVGPRCRADIWAALPGALRLPAGTHGRANPGFHPDRPWPGRGLEHMVQLAGSERREAALAWVSRPGSHVPRRGWPGGAGLAEGAHTRAFLQERERLLRSKRHRGKGPKPPKVSPRPCSRPTLLRAGVRGARPRERAAVSHRMGLQAETPIAACRWCETRPRPPEAA